MSGKGQQMKLPSAARMCLELRISQGQRWVLFNSVVSMLAGWLSFLNECEKIMKKMNNLIPLHKEKKIQKEGKERMWDAPKRRSLSLTRESQIFMQCSCDLCTQSASGPLNRWFQAVSIQTGPVQCTASVAPSLLLLLQERAWAVPRCSETPSMHSPHLLLFWKLALNTGPCSYSEKAC